MGKSLVGIYADNLKLLKQTQIPIDPLTLLVGPNGSGKTAVLNALRLSVLGYEPALGKRLLEVRTQLAAGPGPVETGIAYNDGFAIRRSFGAELETKVVPPQLEKNEGQRTARIKKELGGFVLSLDIRELLDLTPEKRRAYVFGMLPRERAELTQDRFRTALQYEDQPVPVQKAIDQLWLQAVVKGETAVEGLATAIEHANRAALDAEETTRRKRDHLEELQKDLDQAKIAAGAAGYDPTEIERLQAQLEEAQGELAELDAKAAAIDDTRRQQREEFDRYIRTTRRLEQLSTRLAASQRQLKEAQQNLASLGDPVSTEALQKKVTETTLAHGLAVAAEREQQENVNGMRAMGSEDRVQLATLQRELQSLKDAEVCPTCGGTADLEAHRRKLHGQIEELYELVASNDQLLEAELKKLAKLRDAAGRAQDEWMEAQRAQSNEQNVARRRNDLDSSIRRLEGEITAFKNDVEEIAKHDLPAAVPVDPSTLEPDDYPDTDQVSDRIDALRAAIKRQQQLAVDHSKPEVVRGQVDDALEAAQKSEQLMAQLKDLHQRLQVLRGEVIRGMLEPVEETAREILRKVDPQKTFAFQFSREGREVLDFGFEKEGVFRSFAASSNGESAVLIIVLLAALLNDLSPPWRALILDNVEAIDNDPRTRHLERLLSAIAAIREYFDNAILAGCMTEPESAYDEWTVIDMGEISGAYPLGETPNDVIAESLHTMG